MDNILKNIEKCNRILITVDDNNNGLNAIYYGEDFFNFLNNYLKNYISIIVDDPHDYKNYDDYIKIFDFDDKIISFIMIKRLTTKSSYNSDLIFKIMNNGDIHLIKSRYTSKYDKIENVKNLPIFKRKQKINKILNEIRIKKLHIC